MGKVDFSNSFPAMREVLSGTFTDKFLEKCRRYEVYNLPAPSKDLCNNYVEAMKKLNKYLTVLKQNPEHLKRLKSATKLADKGEDVSKLDKDLIAGLIGKTFGWGFLRAGVREKFAQYILLPIIAIEEKLRDVYFDVWPRNKVGEVQKNLKYAAYPSGIVHAIMRLLYDD